MSKFKASLGYVRPSQTNNNNKSTYLQMSEVSYICNSTVESEAGGLP